MVLNSKTLSGIFFIEVVLIKYKIMKSLFNFDIEMGRQAHIPDQLGQNFMPYSMRYYDPIIAIATEGVTD